jgi:hypothetical protein
MGAGFGLSLSFSPLLLGGGGSGSVGEVTVGSSPRRDDLRFRKAPNLCWVLRCGLSGGGRVEECARASGEKSAVGWKRGR